jgi:hypothetical protein
MFGSSFGLQRKTLLKFYILTLILSFYANKVAGGRKYRKNKGICNLLIISNKSFYGQKRGCN